MSAVLSVTIRTLMTHLLNKYSVALILSITVIKICYDGQRSFAIAQDDSLSRRMTVLRLTQGGTPRSICYDGQRSFAIAQDDSLSRRMTALYIGLFRREYI